MENILEKRLAGKITFASMMMLIFVLASIIGSSFIYSRNTTYREFAGKVRSFSE